MKEFKFDNSRFVTNVQALLEDELKGNLDTNTFPWVKSPVYSYHSSSSSSSSSSHASPGQPLSQQNPSSTNELVPLRSTKASWATKRATTTTTSSMGSSSLGGGGGSHSSSMMDGNHGPSEDLRRYGPRVVLFVVGGITYSEIKTCYELMKSQSRDILIGSTHLLTPLYFLNSLKVVHKGPPVSMQRTNKKKKNKTSESTFVQGRINPRGVSSAHTSSGNGSGSGSGGNNVLPPRGSSSNPQQQQTSTSSSGLGGFFSRFGSSSHTQETNPNPTTTTTLLTSPISPSPISPSSRKHGLYSSREQSLEALQGQGHGHGHHQAKKNDTHGGGNNNNNNNSGGSGWSFFGRK